MKLRERINGDPKLQIGLGVVLLLVVAFVLMHKGGGEEAVEEPTAASVGTTSEPALGIEGAEVTEGSEAEASLASLSENVKASPLPHKVIAAYNADQTVAVLFVHDGGVDDKLVKRDSGILHRDIPTEYKKLQFKLFVVPVKQINRYLALTLGLQVQRVPALIILRRKSLSKGNPEASLLYGYQAPSRIVEAVRNASYKGPSGSYHPG